MTSAIPPITPVPLTSLPAAASDARTPFHGGAALSELAPAAPTTASQGAASVAQVARIVAAAQAALANTVDLSPNAKQAIKVQAFQQLVANLVSHIQPGSAAVPSNWPAGGVTPPLQQLLSQLLQQATAPQALPQQLVSVQSWPTALTQAVLQLTSSTAPLTLAPPAAGASQSAAVDDGLPPLQTWLVQQGSVQAADGERHFTLTLRVPVAWAQAQSALAQALPNTAGTVPHGSAIGHLNGLPFAGSVQQLASGTLGLVMQPQLLPGSNAAAAAQAMRTSAVLQLEFQPIAQAAQQAQTAAVYLPNHVLPGDVQAMLQNRGTDPWLLMAQAQADGTHKKPPPNANEQAHLCNRAGCQYQGRATCAQPFCAEMNYLWSIDRAQRRT